MRPFRRRSAGAAHPYAAFWDWWISQGRTLAEQSISGAVDPEEFARTMTERVHSVGELAWELKPGDVSEHLLVISSGGDPTLRALARRVVLAAPEADESWSYVDSRPPSPEPESIVLGGSGAPDIDLARISVTARMNDGRFDVQVHHPAYADLPAQARTEITFLALDATLGEIDTELWLGEIQPVEFPPLDGFGLVALRSVVHDLRRQRLDADGLPKWLLLSGETREGPLRAMVRSPLHPVTAPHLDTYVNVTVPFHDTPRTACPRATPSRPCAPSSTDWPPVSATRVRSSPTSARPASAPCISTSTPPPTSCPPSRRSPARGTRAR